MTKFRIFSLAKLAVIAFAFLALVSCNEEKTESKISPQSDTNSTPKIAVGISKIIMHPALDTVEYAIKEVLASRGFSVEYDLQNANGDINTAGAIAAKFKDQRPNVVVGIGTPMAVSLAAAIKDIPIVFSTVTDPIGAKLVSTVEHGEGNITGVSDAIPSDEHLRIFKEIAGIKTLGYIYTSNEANSVSALEIVQSAAKKLDIKLITQSISKTEEVKQAAEAIAGRVDGIYLSTDNVVFSALPSVINAFAKAGKPIFAGDATQARSGGGCLIFMGVNYYKVGLATGEIVAQILNGTSPDKIPVKFMNEPSESDFVIDLDVVKKLKITIPESYLLQATAFIKDGKYIEKDKIEVDEN
ncbi:ABC transporter substrate-binding protein [Fibrobacterales bacterium]|nr:ABC transporter substrate-binding protein [Fibrobacterales bacterium]